VHYQHTLYYAEALVEAGKQFDMQVYPGKNHSLPDKTTRYHLFTRMTNFLNEELRMNNE
jgi:dipeptidyl-peptidase-4